MRFRNRNETSRKQNNENNKKQKKIPGNTGRFRTSSRAKPEQRQIAKKLEALTAEVVMQLGGGNAGWEAVMSIKTGDREEIEQQYLDGKVDLRTAAAHWIEALSRDAFAGSDPFP